MAWTEVRPQGSSGEGQAMARFSPTSRGAPLRCSTHIAEADVGGLPASAFQTAYRFRIDVSGSLLGSFRTLIFEEAAMNAVKQLVIIAGVAGGFAACMNSQVQAQANGVAAVTIRSKTPGVVVYSFKWGKDGAESDT